MRRFFALILAMAAPSLARGQSTSSAVAPRPRAFTLTAGVGNALGIFGLQGEKYLDGERVSVFGGLGVAPSLEGSCGSRVAVAAGARGYTHGIVHRGFLELSVTLLDMEDYSLATCRPQYGPGVQAGYQLATRGGFTFVSSLGAGFAPGMSRGKAKVVPMLGLGLGYTWHH